MPGMFEQDLNDFPCVAVGEGREALVARQGAQVLSWRAGGRERLYLSPLSGGMRRGDAADAGAPAIRGGVPVCFPQFSDRGPLPKHGFARTMAWQADAAQRGSATFSLRDGAASAAIWPHRFSATLTVTASATCLEVALSVTNDDAATFEFTAALHTYLQVDDILATRLSGLHNARYQDATAGNVEATQHETELRIAAEVDRVYLAPPTTLQLLENDVPALRIEQHGFVDTVVWNPGPERARALRDFPDQDWRRMLCVEAACVAQPVRLAPGESWRGSQVLTTV